MCRPVEEKRKPRRDAPSAKGNSPRTWPPNRHLGARPATVLVAAVNRILPSVCLASVCSGFSSSFSGPAPPRDRRRRRPNRQPNISQDFREGAVDAPWHGWSAPRRGTRWRGCTRASMTFSTRLTATSTDRSALQVRLRALFVPSDRNRPPRGRPRGCYLGRSGSGEAVEALGRLDEIHQGTREWSDQSTRTDPRGPWTHHLHPRGRCGGGEGIDGGAMGRHAGFLSGFCEPTAKM